MNALSKYFYLKNFYLKNSIDKIIIFCILCFEIHENILYFVF